MREQSAVAIDEAQRNRKGTCTAARANVPMGGGVEEDPGRRAEQRDASPSELWPSTPGGESRTGSSCGVLCCCVPNAIATAVSCLCATCLRILWCDRIVTGDCCHSVHDRLYDCKECISGFGRGCVELLQSLAPLVVYEAISAAFSAVLGCFMRYTWGVLCGVLGWLCCACGRSDEHC